jgi:hypothetical protein
MGFVESSLRRLQLSIDGFAISSATFQDVGALKAQIELRSRALRDIAFIHSRLGSLIHRKKGLQRRRRRNSLLGRSRLVQSSRGGRARYPA